MKRYMKRYKEIPIGGIGLIENIRVEVKKYLFTDWCEKCCFSLTAGYLDPCPIKKCSARFREDKKDVYFVEVDKTNK